MSSPDPDGDSRPQFPSPPPPPPPDFSAVKTPDSVERLGNWSDDEGAYGISDAADNMPQEANNSSVGDGDQDSYYGDGKSDGVDRNSENDEADESEGLSDEDQQSRREGWAQLPRPDEMPAASKEQPRMLEASLSPLAKL